MNRPSRTTHDLIVIGGGPAGVAGACRAHQHGLRVVVLEAQTEVGGIPRQCIHPGFGMFYYGNDYTGPEFSERLTTELHGTNVQLVTAAHVSRLLTDHKDCKTVEVLTPRGPCTFTAPTILYATGARERHLHETGIVGDRVAGVYTAGEAQTLMDVDGTMPGKQVVIIGSGDIGLIMARRCALEGATVVGVIEMLPYPAGLTRNVVQCLHDFAIPLHTQRMVTVLRGRRRVERVITVAVDSHGRPLPDTRRDFICDTVLLATGLVPAIRTLEQTGVDIDPATHGPFVTDRLETSCSGVFVAGNALAINDYVDYAATQGEIAAEGAAAYVSGDCDSRDALIPLQRGQGLGVLVPHYVSGQRPVTVYARVRRPMPRATIRLVPTERIMVLQGLTPGEMIHLDLSVTDFGADTSALTMEVVG